VNDNGKKEIVILHTHEIKDICGNSSGKEKKRKMFGTSKLR